MRPAPAWIFAALVLGGCAAGIDLQGHRGARGLAPENTLPAFAHALEIGVTTLELDTGVTRDGVVVVSHDSSLNPDITRGPDGAWLAARGPAIHSLTFAELARYELGRIKPGTSYAAAFPAQVPADGTRFPRLADLFALVKRSGDRHVRFNIETKVTPAAPEETLAPEPFTRAVIAEIREAGMASRSTLQSFDWRTLAIAQREAPEIATVYLTAPKLRNVCGPVRAGVAAGVALSPAAGPGAKDCAPSAWTGAVQLRDHGSVPKMIRAAGGKVWSPYYGDVDAESIAESHALGLGVVVWTVNDPEEIGRLVELGVDGIITDRPDLARAEITRRGKRVK